MGWSFSDISLDRCIYLTYHCHQATYSKSTIESSVAQRLLGATNPQMKKPKHPFDVWIYYTAFLTSHCSTYT